MTNEATRADLVINAGAIVALRLFDIAYRDTYTALYDEASGSRAELLELAIIVLIMIEIVLALISLSH